MRISTAMMFNNMANSSGSLTESLQKINNQLSSGKKIEHSSDNPVDFYKASILKDQQSLLETHLDKLNVVKYRNAAVEQKISASIDVMNEFRDWLVSAKSDNRWESAALLDKDVISGLKDQLLGLANSKNENGDYMFSGFQNNAPFVNNGSNINFIGDQGIRTLMLGNREIQLEPSGDTVFNYTTASRVKVLPAANWYGGNNIGSGFVDANSTQTLASPLNVLFSVDRTVTPAVTKLDVLDTAGNSIINGTNRVSGSNQPIALPLTVSSGSTIDLSTYLGQPANTTQLTIRGYPEDGDSYTINNSTKQNVFDVFDNVLNEMSKALTSTGLLNHNNLNPGVQTLPSNVGKQQWQPVLDKALTSIDSWLASVNAERSKVGDNQRQADNEIEYTNATNTILDAQRSNLEDLDYGSALMKQSQISTQIQALYKSFNTSSSLSLFNYIV